MKFKKLHPDAITPTYATDGAACFDLYAVGIDLFHTVINTLTVRTGLAFEVPENHALLIFSRSGHGFKFDTRLANCVGVVDSDYRGEVLVKLTADNRGGPRRLCVQTGDRVAQAMLVYVPRIALREVSELSDTARGAGGLGSTGA